MRLWIIGLFLCLVSLGTGCTNNEAQEAYLKGNEATEAMNYAEALGHYDRALELDSTMADAYFGRGRAYWFQLRHAQAVADLTRTLESDPDHPWANYFRGISLMNLERFEESVDDLTKATTSDVLPGDFVARALRFRSIAYMNLNRYDDAIDDLTTCIKLDPEQPFYFFERAALYEAVGRPEAAISDYETFLAAAPEYEQAAAVRAKVNALRPAL